MYIHTYVQHTKRRYSAKETYHTEAETEAEPPVYAEVLIRGGVY